MPPRQQDQPERALAGRGIGALRNRVRQLLARGDGSARVRRRMKLTAAIWRNLGVLRFTLFAVGYLWLLALPLPQLGTGTYIDENALQPSQVNTYWSWDDVRRADKFLEEVESLRDRNASSAERAAYFTTEFAKLGIPSATQHYSIRLESQNLTGSNSYAVFSAPRTSGIEAMIISASWKSLTDGYNLRGVSAVLSLAAFLKQYSHWSKDIIFVISDSYLDGMHAWLSAYHGSPPSNADVEPLSISSGVVWTALNIDYPGHSFSHLGVFREGLNGRLPNQDLINSFRVISHHTGGVPVLLYDHHEPTDFPGRETIRHFFSWIPKGLWERGEVMDYGYRAMNILRQFGYQARGRGSGVHGLFHQYRIDAITLFAVPSNGPHGFHALGRTIESTLRTMSNLLERLHASFFFYIMATPSSFLKIGSYLPSVVLVATALMFGGLGEWVNAGWVEVEDESLTPPAEKKGVDATPPALTKKWVSRRRDLLGALVVVVNSHLIGWNLFVVISRSWFDPSRLEYTIPLACWVALMVIPPAVVSTKSSPPAAEAAPLPIILKAITMWMASTLISVTSVLNFSLAALLAVTLGLPLTFATPSRSLPVRIAKYSLYAALALSWLVFDVGVKQAVWDWQVLGVWFAPLVCLVYVPLVLQAGVVSLLTL
ncbi:Gaa1-like protein [Gloeopeniophorella convolvens]|nr:Gaa1-like protein [Gloeopeniophorella convolvens]